MAGSVEHGASVTIKDVAMFAGVSATTVSHALSGRRPVAPATKERIERAVVKLGYRPNATAYSLRTGRTMAISLVVPDIANPFFAQLARGAEQAARERGYAVLVQNSDLDPEREAESILRALSGSVDGVVLASTTTDSPAQRAIASVVEHGTPIVLVDEPVAATVTGGVFADNEDGGRQAARHLAEIGCRKIAMVNGPSELPTARQRAHGFDSGLAELGLVVPPSLRRSVAYQLDAGDKAIAEMLEFEPDIDGVFAADDLLALGAIRALQRAGRSVPEDVAVCGFDDIAWLDMVTPSLTTIAQPIERLGLEAARLLLDGLDSVSSPDTTIVLPVSLVVRDSTRR